MNAASLFLRSAARRLGLVSLIRGVQEAFGPAHAYEDKFSTAFLAAVREGDVVWDIGANLGLYTEQVAARVGNGRVVAFEPAPACTAALTRRFAAEPRVRVEALALGDAEGTLALALDADPLAATHRVVDPAPPLTAGAAHPIAVACTTATAYCARGNPSPNVVKIDVEGYEEEVLEGFGSALDNRALRALFVEVHFRLLEERGRRMAPLRIERALAARGFVVRWLDSSHIGAERPPPQ